MSKGDLLLLTFSAGQSSLSFADAAAESEYLLIVQLAQETAGSTTLTAAGASAPLTGLSKSLFVETDEDQGATAFETFLRATEKQFTAEGLALHAPRTTGKSIATTIAVNSTQTFRILSSLSSVSSYDEVTATARCVNSRVALFVDTTVDSSLPGVMATSDYQTLCDQFGSVLDIEYDILGDPPDINGDGVVTVLMTPKVNSLGASGGGIVTGFFFAGDVLTRSASNPASNQQEIVFVLSPDPDGIFGTKIAKSFAMSNLLTAVVPHEVQHLLSYYYHVQVNGGSSETSWLNEGMSHLLEDVVGYGQENPSRIALFLASLADSPLIPSSSPDLSERGGLYLFLRFLYEQAGSDGNAFLRALVQTSTVGVDNIVNAFGAGRSEFDTFPEFLQRWGVAIAATDTGVTTDVKYLYGARTLNSTTGHWHGVCLICDPDDGRNTPLNGPTMVTYGGQSVTLKAGSSVIFNISSIPDSVSISGTSSSTLQGTLLRTK